ncbi:8956_t:CDS:2 [Ambispora gerdemannii]|uniref:8956_t:CDS:1 n=1 Tax=Ambispora gerdemannii TaxID=144530 RepID=A0A9N9BI12_9GLOM|nr:8956_t:CDS:2 [Ambispora gerdemannii]
MNSQCNRFLIFLIVICLPTVFGLPIVDLKATIELPTEGANTDGTVTVTGWKPEIVTDAEDTWVRTTLRIKNFNTKKRTKSHSTCYYEFYDSDSDTSRSSSSDTLSDSEYEPDPAIKELL